MAPVITKDNPLVHKEEGTQRNVFYLQDDLTWYYAIEFWVNGMWHEITGHKLSDDEVEKFLDDMMRGK